MRFEVWGLRFGVWGLGFRVSGFGYRGSVYHNAPCGDYSAIFEMEMSGKRASYFGIKFGYRFRISVSNPNSGTAVQISECHPGRSRHYRVKVRDSDFGFGGV